MTVSFRYFGSLAICVALGIALSGCATKPAPVPPLRPEVANMTTPTHPLTENKPSFLTLPNLAASHIPIRVGVILPFTSGSANTRALAAAMLKSAQLALYDSGNHDVILMTADEGATPGEAALAATRLLDEGAEILVGPLFAQSVKAVSHEARDRGVAVVAFSTDKNVAGDGIYLLGFLPENDAARIASYAVLQGHHKFAALVPQTAYGDVTLEAFRSALVAQNASLGEVERYEPTSAGVLEPATKIAKSDADAIFIPQGAALLRTISPTLGLNGFDSSKTQLLGTSLWDDAANLHEPSLRNGWFATVEPQEDEHFVGAYRHAFGSDPPQLASLSYDAISLIAALAKGEPYKRFTRAALGDPNGFSGVDGIFRFLPDGTADRGLAIVEVTADGFKVIEPAPKTFQKLGS